MKLFKRKAKGGSGTVVTTVVLPDGVTPDKVRITVEGHGGSGTTEERS